MKLVSSQTDEERKIEFAKREAQHALIDLTANLLRVTRGAGRAYSIPSQLVDCALAMQKYREVAGYGLGDSEISEMLSIRLDYDPRRSEIDCAQETITRGALQIAASRLLGQSTQERAGESELMEGANELQRAREERRREFTRPFTERANLPKPAPTKRPVETSGAPVPAVSNKQKPVSSVQPNAKPKPNAKGLTGHKAILAAYKAERGIE